MKIMLIGVVLLLTCNLFAMEWVELHFDSEAKLKLEKQGQERQRVKIMPMTEKVVDEVSKIKDVFINKELVYDKYRLRKGEINVADEVLIPCMAKMNELYYSSGYLDGKSSKYYQVFDLKCDYEKEVLW